MCAAFAEAAGGAAPRGFGRPFQRRACRQKVGPADAGYVRRTAGILRTHGPSGTGLSNRVNCGADHISVVARREQNRFARGEGWVIGCLAGVLSPAPAIGNDIGAPCGCGVVHACVQCVAVIGGFHHQDVGVGRHGMGPFEVKHFFKCPSGICRAARRSAACGPIEGRGIRKDCGGAVDDRQSPVSGSAVPANIIQNIRFMNPPIKIVSVVTRFRRPRHLRRVSVHFPL